MKRSALAVLVCLAPMAADAQPEPLTIGERLDALERKQAAMEGHAEAKDKGGQTDRFIPHSGQGCGGDFGLLLPLFGVSNRTPSRMDPNRRNDIRITLPVDSGIGGGYYLPINKCNTRWSVDLSVFTFSEGLDPSKKFQLGAGVGIGLTAFKKFQVGVGLGLDFIRYETIEIGGVSRTYLNGLLVGNDVFTCRGESSYGECLGRNITLLLTFSVTPGSSEEPKPKK